MEYSLTYKSHSYLTVKRNYKKCEIIPNSFKYNKKFPEGERTYKKVININFRWLFWNYELLLRKPRS